MGNRGGCENFCLLTVLYKIYINLNKLFSAIRILKCIFIC